MSDLLTALRDHVPWLAPVLVFGLVVFVHEFGHFIAAKLTGVYAPRFSIGFGPALWHHRWGETEYRLGALPLGGYVRMASRDDDASALIEGGNETAPTPGPDWDPNAMIPFGPRPIPENRWFESKPLVARLIIMLAGVTMNVLLAFVVMTGVYAYYGKAGTQTPVIDSVRADMPAAGAGLIAGDSVVAVGGVPVRTAIEAQDRLRPSAGKPLAIDVVRSGTLRRFTVTPAAVADTDPSTHAIQTIGRVGVLFHAPRDPIPIWRAAGYGFTATVDLGGLILKSVADLATGKVSIKQLSGPVRIAQVSVEAARSGIESLAFLLALISVNVAIFNLLPIPILDGGQIVVNLIEAIRGTPLSLRTRELVVRTGLVAIALIIVLAMYNDRCVLLPGLC